jgi:hypothetical protein
MWCVKMKVKSIVHQNTGGKNWKIEGLITKYNKIGCMQIQKTEIRLKKNGKIYLRMICNEK